MKNKKMTNSFFFDIHCHTMTLSQINLMSFLRNLQENKTADFIDSLTGSNVIAERKSVSQSTQNVLNLFGLMQNDLKHIFFIMEDDLKGKYLKGKESSVYRNDALCIGDCSYREIVLTPLLMDFSAGKDEEQLTYYPNPGKSLKNAANEYAFAIKNYYKERPDGMLTILPFAGINPANYTPEELDRFLKDCFSLYDSKGLLKSVSAQKTKTRLSSLISPQNLFAGIKLYPPMGFDPWPEEEGEAKEKVKMLYSFAREKNIPLTVHCNDSGFITVDYKTAMEYTSPAKWKKVLSRFPELHVNLAHFGIPTDSVRSRIKNKISSVMNEQKIPWTNQILELMQDFPNLYSDFSFNGVKSSFYTRLQEILGELPDNKRETAEKRLMFGSDFMINLSSIESYHSYYEIYNASPLNNQQKEMFASENPARFMGMRNLQS